MKYKLIEELYPVDLEREVNAAIERGWEPIGGVSVVHYSGGGDFYYQAVVFGGKE